jgi:ABC-type bacteriocin/lantibiotic exporter with double-glycine peptidase domain
VATKDNGHHAAGADHSLYHHVHPWVRLKGLLVIEARDLWVAVIYSIGIGLVGLTLPVAVQALVNTVAFGTVLQPLVVLTTAVFVAFCFATVLHGYRVWVVELIQRRILVRTAGEVTLRLVNVRASAFDKYHGPELVNRFLEVVTVQKAASSLLLEGLTVVFSTLIGMALLAFYHPWLLAFDAILLVFFAIVLVPLASGAIPTAVKESKAKYSLVAWLEEVARNQISFKSGPGAAFAFNKTNQLVTDYLYYRSKHFRVLMRQILGSHFLQAVASAILLGIGGWLVIRRELTLGQLVAAELVVTVVVSSFTKFGKHLEAFYDLMAATDKLGYLSDLPLERSGGERIPVTERGAHLRVRDVSIGYPERGRLFDGANLDLPAGSRIGLAGATGKGKSTILDVMYGLREPESGFLELDGRDYRDIRLSDLRAQVTLVRQPEIFEGSLLDNLRLGLENCDSVMAKEALDKVGLLQSVLELPDGIHTRLSSGGQPLSPGQCVQLELARGLLHNPRLLIIDESLDYLDDLPQKDRLLKVLFSPKAPWTLLVVSQDPSILARCERVYAIRNHKIIETAPIVAARL